MLNKERFAFYTGYPSAIYILASYIMEHNIELKNKPKYIVTGAESLLPGVKSIIEDAFRAPVTEQYGQVEACGNLSKCEHVL